MTSVVVIKRIAAAVVGVGTVVALAVWMHGRGVPNTPRIGDAHSISAAASPKGEVAEPPLDWDIGANLTPESAPKRSDKSSLSDITERARAESELLEASRNPMNQLPEDALTSLATSGNPSAQEALGAKLFISSPAEALELALGAAKDGRPMGAFMVAELLATQKNEVAEGLLFLDSYEEKHGPSALVERYRKSYLSIHQLTQEEIMTEYRLLKSNKQRGAPQKYPLTAASDLKAPAHPAPP